METTPIWQTGCWERSKAGVHGAACALAAIMAGYNAFAWFMRRERHLAVNVVVYTVAACWEVQQTSRHWERLAPSATQSKDATVATPRVAAAPGSDVLSAA
jgi:hypothetical protein